MRVLTQEDFVELMEPREGPCVSIFIPTERAGKPTEQNPIRLKNALKEARTGLEDLGMRTAEVDELLEHAQTLIRDGRFWRQQSDGLAVFLAPGFARHYRVPLSFEPSTVVSERFHIKPMLPLLTTGWRYYVLALSQKNVRLFEATRDSIQEVHLIDVPESLAEYLQYTEVDAQTPDRSFTYDITGKPGVPSQNVAIFHGQGEGGDMANKKVDIREFLRQVEQGVRDVLREQRVPLVLAGVEYIQAMYHEVNKYPHLLKTGYRGNMDILKPEEIHQRTLEIVEPEFRKIEQEAAERYGDMTGAGRTSTDLADIVRSAAQGRVDTLFVVRGVEFWGNYDAESGEVELHLEKQSGDQDVLDLAAYHAMRNGASVFDVDPDEMPDAAAAAAIYRY